MTHDRFNEVVEEELTYVKNLLIRKQAEYNLDEDRFDSFKHAAVIANEDPHQVLLGYVLKHWTSLADMINSGEVFSRDLWKEKISDSINYALLLLGLVEDINKAE